MEHLDKIQQFQLFCFESYRSEKQLSGLTVLKQFKKYGIFNYLKTGFDVLHTQGRSFIIADIDSYLQNRK